MSLALIACAIADSAASVARPCSTGSISLLVQASLGTAPALSISWRCSPISSLIPFCATLSASRISASDTSSEPPSTMTIESAVPLTTRSMVENSSCWKVGLRIQLPSTRPTRTPASGPFHGTGERLSAVEAATTPRMSASFSWSADSTVTKTWTSFLKPSGKSGRIERSISRLARISLSEGRPSRLRNPPGILPAA